MGHTIRCLKLRNNKQVLSAREEFLSGVLSFEFHMWQKVSREQRIEYGGERYRIEDVDLNRRKRKLIVKASRVNE